jgi:hypothetical protein
MKGLMRMRRFRIVVKNIDTLAYFYFVIDAETQEAAEQLALKESKQRFPWNCGVYGHQEKARYAIKETEDITGQTLVYITAN